MKITEKIKDKIHDLAVEQITADFEFIKNNAKSRNETLYGFAIGIVADVTGFFSTGNTLESLVRILNKYEERNFHPSYFWWIPDWEYKGTGNNELYKFLDKTFYTSDFDWSKMESFRKIYEQILLKSLETCNELGVFGKGEERNNIIVYIQYVDSCDENLDDIASEQINSQNNHLLFKERWNNKTNNLTKIITDKIKTLPNIGYK